MTDIDGNNIQYDLEINGEKKPWNGKFITGKQIKELVGLPVEGYEVWAKNEKTEIPIKDDESIDLDNYTDYEFTVRETKNGQKSYEFTLNGEKEVWTSPTISGKEMKIKAGDKPEEVNLYRELSGKEDDPIIEDGDEVDLTGNEDDLIFYTFPKETNEGGKNEFFAE